MSTEQDLVNALGVLRNGGLILYPTDTIWGIGCDATNDEAVDKIFTLKQRPDSKALIVLVAEERDIMQYVAAPDPAIFNYLSGLTRPVTVIYPGAIGLASNLAAADGSVGIRICHDPFCRHLIKRLRKPIVSTSANVSGSPSPSSFENVTPQIREGVDYIAEHRRNDLTPAQPSMIIRWERGQPVVIRP